MAREDPTAARPDAEEDEERRFRCTECRRGFRTSCSLLRHRHCHSEVKPYQCGVCGRGFVQGSDLRAHRRRCPVAPPRPAGAGAGGRTRFSCQVCGSAFGRAAHLRRHAACCHAGGGGQGARPFSCQVCGRAFSRSCNLVQHQRTHTAERPYSCPLCPRRFNRAYNVLAHQRSRHGAREPPRTSPACRLLWHGPGINGGRRVSLTAEEGQSPPGGEFANSLGDSVMFAEAQ
ncbi:zinc finger and SCAN domain-containing protein 2-like [Rhincodon typus]|uniref:zinc finger and SCAN domain-containing protein 2-like n=1 Tax=Rhincodon typus TaxID=259920 RepID=UPI002030962C|nr:zinc finger and SCAN domain-containing protein 2-like [Rhincodon typus]